MVLPNKMSLQHRFFYKSNKYAESSATTYIHCITETMRLHPAALITQRVATEDVTLQAENGEELHMKRGQGLTISLLGIHKNPKNFPEPEDFDPTRIYDEKQRRSLLVFGDGPRKCPGWCYSDDDFILLGILPSRKIIFMLP